MLAAGRAGSSYLRDQKSWVKRAISSAEGGFLSAKTTNVISLSLQADASHSQKKVGVSHRPVLHRRLRHPVSVASTAAVPWLQCHESGMSCFGRVGWASDASLPHATLFICLHLQQEAAVSHKDAESSKGVEMS